MQAASESALGAAPFFDFSHRHAAWRLGRGVNITLSGLNLFGLCSRVLDYTVGKPRGDLSGARQAAVASAWPDQLLQAVGLPPQGRALALASPLWSMLPEAETGNQTSLSIGPNGNVTWYTAENGQEGIDPADLPMGWAHVQQAVMVVPAAELLLHHYLSAWADAMPALLVQEEDAAPRSTGGTSNSTAGTSHARIYASLHASLRPVVDVMTVGQAESGAGGSLGSTAALRAYSLAPTVVHLAEWARSPSGNSVQVRMRRILLTGASLQGQGQRDAQRDPHGPGAPRAVRMPACLGWLGHSLDDQARPCPAPYPNVLPNPNVQDSLLTAYEPDAGALGYKLPAWPPTLRYAHAMWAWYLMKSPMKEP